MRVVTLSDFTAELLRKATEPTAANHQIARVAWHLELDRYQDFVTSLENDARKAWDAGHLISAIRLYIKLWKAQRGGVTANPLDLLKQDAERRVAAGQLGEARVLGRLQDLFDDDWVAFQGYVNHAGETDLLLLGPTGFVAIEVKYINGIVHCNGAKWTRDKVDRYGNVVEHRVPIQDKGGRSPSEQVNAVADQLEAHLKRLGHPVSMRRAVLLAHENSRIGQVIELPVNLLATLTDSSLGDRVRALVEPTHADRRLDVGTIEQLVTRHHRDNTKPSGGSA
jgi:hypothetical protein